MHWKCKGCGALIMVPPGMRPTMHTVGCGHTDFEFVNILPQQHNPAWVYCFETHYDT